MKAPIQLGSQPDLKSVAIVLSFVGILSLSLLGIISHSWRLVLVFGVFFGGGLCFGLVALNTRYRNEVYLFDDEVMQIKNGKNVTQIRYCDLLHIYWHYRGVTLNYSKENKSFKTSIQLGNQTKLLDDFLSTRTPQFTVSVDKVVLNRISRTNAGRLDV